MESRWDSHCRIAGTLGSSRRLRIPFDFLDHLSKLPEGQILQLADPLAGHSEFLAHLLECALGPAIQAKPIPQNGGFTRLQAAYQAVEQVGERFLLKLLIRSRRVF